METFVNIFDQAHLKTRFSQEFKDVQVVIYGEQYGGKQQRMSETYGTTPMFIVFEVKIGDTWLNVPNAEDVANKLGLEFVPYVECSTDIKELDAQRDAMSIVAERRGCGKNKIREGIVIRPLEEYLDKRSNRVIVKHKRDEFMETKTPRQVDPEKLKILEEARAISEEWVTEQRLSHVLDHLGNPSDISSIRDVIKEMIEDVLREAKGEIVESQAAKRAIGTTTALMFKKRISKI